MIYLPLNDYSLLQMLLYLLSCLRKAVQMSVVRVHNH